MQLKYVVNNVNKWWTVETNQKKNLRHVSSKFKYFKYLKY